MEGVNNKLTLEHIEYIVKTAHDLFVNVQIPSEYDDEGRLRQVTPMPDQFQDIMGIIGDSGLIFISSWEDLGERWAEMRADNNDNGTAEFLVQTAAVFKATAFTSSIEYDHWINHLAGAYGAQNPSERINGAAPHASIERNIAVDDDFVGRLPTESGFQDLLRANPWFVYLVTLQMSFHRIWSQLISTHRDAIMRMGGQV